MNRLTSLAIISIALCSFLTKAQAQNAFRCGNSYSQTPCPGGVPVNADDSRSKAQKSQSESVIKHDLRTAGSMEKTRLQQEEARKRAAQLPAEKPAAKSTTTTEPGKPTQSTKKRSHPPEYFTARTQGDKKKKKNETATSAGTSTGNGSTAK